MDVAMNWSCRYCAMLRWFESPNGQLLLKLPTPGQRNRTSDIAEVVAARLRTAEHALEKR